jgi:hypothetical protein
MFGVGNKRTFVADERRIDGHDIGIYQSRAIWFGGRCQWPA